MTTAVSVGGISVSFEGQQILDGISFEVEVGERLGVLGVGGSGKTLLLKIIAGLQKPDSGSVEIHGANILEMSDSALQTTRNGMGMLFQNYALFDFLTVAENVAFALTQQGVLSLAEVKEKADHMLNQLGLSEAGSLYPHELSGGMKKRVGIGRATLHQPQLVLYDDPTAGLDPVTSSKILKLLNNLHNARNTSCIIASHDSPRLAQICDRFLVLSDGRIHYHGAIPEEEMTARDPILYAFFGSIPGTPPHPSLPNDPPC